MQTPRERHRARSRKRFNTWLKQHNPVEALPFRLVVDTSVEEDVVQMRWLE